MTNIKTEYTISRDDEPIMRTTNPRVAQICCKAFRVTATTGEA